MLEKRFWIFSDAILLGSLRLVKYVYSEKTFILGSSAHTPL